MRIIISFIFILLCMVALLLQALRLQVIPNPAPASSKSVAVDSEDDRHRVLGIREHLGSPFRRTRYGAVVSLNMNSNSASSPAAGVPRVPVAVVKPTINCPLTATVSLMMNAAAPAAGGAT